MHLVDTTRLTSAIGSGEGESTTAFALALPLAFACMDISLQTIEVNRVLARTNIGSDPAGLARAEVPVDDVSRVFFFLSFDAGRSSSESCVRTLAVKFAKRKAI